MIDKVTPYPIPTVCDYCGSPVIFTSNAVIYGKEYGNGKCYKCTRCDAFVGIHTGTEIPLGRLANKKLRELKKKCHALFDPVWKNSKNITRDSAYSRLADKLKIPVGICHFGWFNGDMLLRCIDIMSDKKWFFRRPKKNNNKTRSKIYE